MTAEEMIRKVPNILDLGPFRTFLEEGLAKGQALGRAEGIREMILVQGRKKLGEPTAEQESALIALLDVVQLEMLAEKLLDATTWEVFLRTP